MYECLFGVFRSTGESFNDIEDFTTTDEGLQILTYERERERES